MATPKLRFKGFSDEWNQRRLGDLGTFKNGMNFSKESMGKGYPFVNIQNLFGRNTVDINSLELAEATNKQLEDYSLKQGDVLFVRSSVKLEGVGEAALVSEDLENTTYSGFIIRFRDTFGLHDNFKRFIFCTDGIRKQILSKATKSANININQPILENIALCLPSLNEQKKIGQFFSSFDDFITHHENGLEQLRKAKRYFLQRMFPQEGQDVPDLRFAGFSSAWKKCELGAVVNVQCGRDYKHLSTGNIPVYGTGGYMLSVNEALSYDEDAIGIGRKGTIDKPYILRAPFWTVDTLFYAVPHPSRDLEFVYCLFQNVDWAKKDESTGVPSLSKTIINSQMVIIPDILEQKKIGAFFSSLDGLIAQREHELALLRKLKVFLLQTMFPEE